VRADDARGSVVVTTGREADMSKYGTRLNVLFAVVALLIGVAQLSKAAEGNAFAIVISLVAAIMFVVALMGAMNSSRQGGE
jgi:Na+(H+)/acetate symporter ActP